MRLESCTQLCHALNERYGSSICLDPELLSRPPRANCSAFTWQRAPISLRQGTLRAVKSKGKDPMSPKSGEIYARKLDLDEPDCSSRSGGLSAPTFTEETWPSLTVAHG